METGYEWDMLGARENGKQLVLALDCSICMPCILMSLT